MKNFFCFILFINGMIAYTQPIMKDVYEFPVKQGTDEWGQFETIEKRIAALQIPDAILEKISTEGLLETCLYFPYLTDMFFYNNYQNGFEGLMAEFNGFRELFKRRELPNVLLQKYRSLTEDVKDISSQNNVEQGMFSFRHFALEFMLAQDVVLKNLSEEQEKQLLLLSLEHKKIKRSYSEIFSNLNDLPINLLYAKKIMKDFNLKNNEMKKTLSDFIVAPISVDQQIIDYIENYINVKYK